MKREFSAGGIVFKDGKVLVTQHSQNLHWSFPKGLLDHPDQTMEESALREVREEGGVEAKIIKKLPTIKTFFRDKGELVLKFITYFVMEYESDALEGFGEETAEIKWVTKEEAFKLLAHKNERELLREA